MDARKRRSQEQDSSRITLSHGFPTSLVSPPRQTQTAAVAPPPTVVPPAAAVELVLSRTANHLGGGPTLHDLKFTGVPQGLQGRYFASLPPSTYSTEDTCVHYSCLTGVPLGAFVFTPPPALFAPLKCPTAQRALQLNGQIFNVHT